LSFGFADIEEPRNPAKDGISDQKPVGFSIDNQQSKGP